MAKKTEKTDKASSIWSNWIVRNLIWALAFIVALLVAAMIFLNMFTKHNQASATSAFRILQTFPLRKRKRWLRNQE